MFNDNFCPLSKTRMPEKLVKSIEYNGYHYFNDVIGEAIISIFVTRNLERHSSYLPILAGICRNRFEDNEEPIPITEQFIDEELKNYRYPNSFSEKKLHLLNYISKKSGLDRDPISLSSNRDFPIPYAKDEKKFIQIMNDLEQSNWIKIESKIEKLSNITIYQGVTLTDEGELTINKFGVLLKFSLNTNDEKLNNLFNHSQQLFFRNNSTIEDKRSACQSLSLILEGVKGDLKSFFSDSDIEFLSKIINEYDIRHNKSRTIQLIHVEQVEWIYYSLMNTILTYFKLNNKFLK